MKMLTHRDPYADLEPDIAVELLDHAPQEPPTSNSPEPELPWSDPQELPSLFPQAPRLPAEMLPDALRTWLCDVSERLQVPLEFAAAPAIVGLSAVVGRKFGIHPKRRDDWLVIPNLWGVDIERPGTMKSATIVEALKPLGNLAARAHKEYEQTFAECKASAEVHKARIQAVKDLIKAAAKKRDENEIAELRKELSSLESVATGESTERRYRVNDATTEKLIELLRDNPRGLLVYRDELFGWLRNLDKVGHEGDREFYLEGWNGDGAFTSDRIGRGTVHAEGVCLSLFGGIQPGKLAAYVDNAINGLEGDDGLLQRFQMAVYPEPSRTWQNEDRYPNQTARDRAYRLFETLDNLNPEALGVLPGKFQSIPALRFDPDAQDFFDAWRSKLETKLRSGEIEAPAFISHLAKYRSLMPSLALLFHLGDWADAQLTTVPPPGLEPVSLLSAKLAAAWCDFLELHARKIYAGVIQPDIHAAHALAGKIRERKIKDGASVRDVYRNQWAMLKTKACVYDGLAILQDLNWARVQTIRKSEGGAPSDMIRINPKFRGESK